MLTRSSSEPLCLALQLYMRLVTRGNPLLQDQHCQVGTDTHAEPLHPCASLNARVLGVLDLRIQVEQVWRRENLANHGPASDIRNPKCDPVLPMDLLRMRLKSKKSCPTFLSPFKTSSLLMGPSPHKPRKFTSILRLCPSAVICALTSHSSIIPKIRNRLDTPRPPPPQQRCPRAAALLQ